LAIELDGGQHAFERQVSRDAVRDSFLGASGYRVLRFWNHDVMTNIDGALALIAETIDSEAATPHP
jgi:very-short-patch-repair endonuclease